MGLPSPELRHLLSRFSYGITPGLVAEAQDAGPSPMAWFSRQLDPGKVPDSSAGSMRQWYPHLDTGPKQLVALNDSGEYPAWQSTYDLARWTIMRRTYSKRQLLEQMVEFWSNLLHVPLYTDAGWMYRLSYDQMIRQHALGTFVDMLHASVTHPGMGTYLNNVESTKWAVNENLGRELLELHTVGVEAGYSEREVLASARIITGYKVDWWNSWRASYDPDRHWTGKVKVLGFSAANDKADGRDLVKRYVRYLALHPSTAQRMVDAVAKAWIDSGSDIKTVLRTLVRHQDFQGAAGQKVRTPSEDVIASYRVLGAKATNPHGDDQKFARAVAWQLESSGQLPFGWPQPDGFPETNIAWSTVGRVLSTFSTHETLAGGWWPSQGVQYPSAAQRLPDLPARFDEVVDHVSRRLTQRRASEALQEAARSATGWQAGDMVRKASDFEWPLVLLMSTVLNSPAHVLR